VPRKERLEQQTSEHTAALLETDAVRLAERAILGPVLYVSSAPRAEHDLCQCEVPRLIERVDRLLEVVFISEAEAVLVKQMSDKAEVCGHIARALRRADVYYTNYEPGQDDLDWTNDDVVSARRRRHAHP
jgi:hypothetical protein